MIALKIVKWKIAWKNGFCCPCEECQISCRFFLLAANFESDGMTSHKHGVAAKTVSKCDLQSQSFTTNFFRIAGTSEAETSVSGKAECFLAIGQD